MFTNNQNFFSQQSNLKKGDKEVPHCCTVVVEHVGGRCGRIFKDHTNICIHFNVSTYLQSFILLIYHRD